MPYIILFTASFLIWFLYAGLIILWIIDGRVKKEVALHAFISSISAQGLAEVLKSLFQTVRPFVENGGSIMTISTPTNAAFPSTHSAAGFALAFAVFLHNRKLGVVFLIGALLVGVARVMANVHYPIDILGGAVLGIIVAFIFDKLHVGKLF